MSNAQAMAKLAAWAKRFEKLASPQFKGALTKEMSKQTLDFIEEGFRLESTPYRQKWRPKKQPNGQKILVDRDIMRRRFRAKVGLGSFAISNSQPYAAVHQNGSKKRNIPKRQMWPKANRLPVRWVRAYSKTFATRTWRIIKGK